VPINNQGSRTNEGVIRTYIKRIRAFTPNARKYLISVMIFGAGFGVHRILFNFFLGSLGFDETFMGLLSTVSSMTVLIIALPMGYLADMLGRKISLVISGLLIGSSMLLMVIFPSAGLLIGMNVLMGVGSSLGGVVTGPFLMENSGEEERSEFNGLCLGDRCVRCDCAACCDSAPAAEKKLNAC